MADAESFLREHVNPLARIKGNVAKMVAQGAPESDIDGYIASEGVTLDAVRNFKMPQHFDLGQAPGDDPSKLPAGYDPQTGHVTQGTHLGAGLGGIVEGVPIVGGPLKEGAMMAANAMAGGDAKSLQQMESRTAQEADDHRLASLAGNVTGAVAGTLPAMAAAPEAFGLGAAPLAARMGAGFATGGAIGGTDAAVRSGGDPEQIAMGAGLGAGLGMLGVPAGRGVGMLAGGLRSWFNARGAAKAAGMPKAAFADIAKDMTADKLTAAVAKQKMADMPGPAMLMDLGENLRGRAGAIAATPGSGQEVVRSAVKDRDAGANARIRGGVDSTLGKAVPPSQVAAEVKANLKAIGPEYDTAIAKAKAVDTQGVANDLESGIVNERGAAQAKLREVRKMLDIAGTDVLDPSPRTLHATRVRRSTGCSRARKTPTSSASSPRPARRSMTN
jgi:hypothetical protein